MSTVDTLQGLLRKFGPFAQLSDDELNQLSGAARPFSCPTGQELLRGDRLPEQVYAIVEGRGRLLHSDPAMLYRRQSLVTSCTEQQAADPEPAPAERQFGTGPCRS